MKTTNNKKEFKRTGLKIVPKKVPATSIQLPEITEEKPLPYADFDSRISSSWGRVVAHEILNDLVNSRITKLKDTIRFMRLRVDLLSQGDFKAREAGIDNYWLRTNLLPCLDLLDEVEKFVAKGKAPNDKEWGALMAPHVGEQGIRSTLTIIGKHLQLPPISTNAWNEAKYIRAKEKFISTHADTWIGPVIADYLKFVERLQKAYEDKNYVGENLRFNARTKLTCLYVATRFLVFAKESGLTDCLQIRQHHLNTFYTNNSISASFAGYFVKYLNKTGSFSFKFTAPKNKRTIDISDIFTQDEIDSISENLFDNEKYPQEKLLAIFSLFYAQSAHKVIKMPITRINIINNGDMTFRFNLVDVPIHPEVAVKIREWLFNSAFAYISMHRMQQYLV